MSKDHVGESAVEAKVRVAVTFHQPSRGIDSRSRPIVIFHADRQSVLLIKIDDAAVKRDLLAGVVAVDRLDPCTAAAVVFVFLDMNLRSIQAVLQLPRLAIAIDQVANAGLSDAVPARLERTRVA